MVKPKEVHQLFKQAMISRRYVSADLAVLLWKKVENAARSLDEAIPANYDPEEVDVYIEEINETIKGLSLEFKSRHDQITGKKMWALVNTVDGEIAQSATEYSPLEIAYFKQLIDLIMLAPGETYCVSSFTALREVNNMKSTMTKTAAETTLNNLVAKGWLYKSTRGRYALGTRSLLELELYLRRTYVDEIIDCITCSQLLTLGVACKNAECTVRLHKHCYQAHIQHAKKCMTCNADWSRGTGVRKLGEEGAVEGFDDGVSKRRKSRREEEEPEAEQSDDQMEAEDAHFGDEDQKPSVKKGKGRGKLVRKSQLTQAQADEEEDVKPAQAMEVDSEEEPPAKVNKGKGRAR